VHYTRASNPLAEGAPANSLRLEAARLSVARKISLPGSNPESRSLSQSRLYRLRLTIPLIVTESVKEEKSIELSG
jgi:hypothetical protein